VVALVGAVLLGGCLGDDDEPSLSAEETAHAWVDAINAEDYERACELSVFALKSQCVEVMREKPFGEELEIEGFYLNESGADSEGTFAVSSSGDRKPRGDGWTAYAPTGGFVIERVGDSYLVHFEFSVIK
jgi:hypothetical protein